jgi:hypothetical protein
MTKNNRRHVPGNLESGKFENKRPKYLNYLNELKDMGYEFEDFLHYFPCFVGDLTLLRMLTLLEAYNDVEDISGHIADVGMFRGASSFWFAKLTKLYHPNSLTQVHGFDWFEGNQPDPWEKNIVIGGGKESFQRVKKLSRLQGLDNILKVHKLNLKDELEDFFTERPHLKFKLIFMDAGMYSVVKSSLPFFWNRLSRGGIIIFDQYNFDIAPGETKAVDEFFSELGVTIKTFKYSWMPTAYIKK